MVQIMYRFLFNLLGKRLSTCLIFQNGTLELRLSYFSCNCRIVSVTVPVTTKDMISKKFLVLIFVIYDGFGGLVVSMLASGTQVCGFKPDRNRWIFRDVKILSMPSSGGEVKESVPYPSFAACQRT